MERYGVARMTARQALGVLQEEGLVVARKGAGVFVRASSVVPRIVRANPARSSVWRSASSPWDKETGSEALVIDRLSVTMDSADVVRSRRYLVGVRPVMLAVSRIPVALAAGTPIAEADTGPGGIYARLADVGHAPVRFNESVTGRLATGVERQELNLRSSAVVLEVRRLAFDVDELVVEVSDLVMDANAFTLSYDFDA